MWDEDAERTAFAADHAAGDLGQWLSDCRQSIIFLTRLPLSREAAPAVPDLAAAMRAFPLAGLVVGAIVGAVLVLAVWLGAPVGLSALLALGAGLLVTGALHEDGLADVADGFGGGEERERKLEIMRDSRIGTYGVLALMVMLGLKVLAIAVLAAQSLWLAFAVVVAAAAVSRAAPVGLLHVLAPARRDGVSAAAGRPGRSTVLQALATGTLISVVLLGPQSILVALVLVPLAGFAGLFGVVWLARRQIGGQTGDVAGASQTVSEVVILLAAVMVLPS